MSKTSDAIRRLKAEARVMERAKQNRSNISSKMVASISGAEYEAMWEEIMDLSDALSKLAPRHRLLLTEADRNNNLMAMIRESSKSR